MAKAESEQVIDGLRGLGIEIDEVTQQLEEEGIRAAGTAPRPRRGHRKGYDRTK